MELWQGIMGVGGWTRRYFVIEDSTLKCCDRQKGCIETEIQLKDAVLRKSKRSDSQFTVSVGSNCYRLRTETEYLRDKWVEAL